jgi:DNA-binding CsgD family transcriptional regulator
MSSAAVDSLSEGAEDSVLAQVTLLPSAEGLTDGTSPDPGSVPDADNETALTMAQVLGEPDGSARVRPYLARPVGREGVPENGPRLSAREIDVLRLVAEGYDTADVAEQLAYSESTIKGVLAKVMARLDARNRSHAVALAVRTGLI